MKKQIVIIILAMASAWVWATGVIAELFPQETDDSELMKQMFFQGTMTLRLKDNKYKVLACYAGYYLYPNLSIASLDCISMFSISYEDNFVL